MTLVIEVLSIIYLIAVFIISSIISTKIGKIIKNWKIEVLADWLLVLLGSIYLSFFLLKNEDFFLKYSFPGIVAIFLLDVIIRIIWPDKNKEKIDKIFAEENEWKQKAGLVK